jgi:hypothetical protein
MFRMTSNITLFFVSFEGSDAGKAWMKAILMRIRLG